MPHVFTGSFQILFHILYAEKLKVGRDMSGFLRKIGKVREIVVCGKWRGAPTLVGELKAKLK